MARSTPRETSSGVRPAARELETYRADLTEERRMRGEFMARHSDSPFLSSGTAYHPLRYFDIDPSWRVGATLERIDPPREAYLRTNRDGQAVMRYLGDLRFRVGPRSLRLRLYHAGEGIGTSVFVPFRDGTSCRESYGPGPYLTQEHTDDDRYLLDFNRAFNPYCAYTDAYECGFPPAENDLPVPVRAGEMVWSPERNPATPSTAVRELLRGRERQATSGAPPAPARATGRGTPRAARSGRTARRRPRG